MKTPKIGDYIRWWVEGNFPGTKKSYAGTIIEEHPGWRYHFKVACVDGKDRFFKISTLVGTDEILYEPEYINYSE